MPRKMKYMPLPPVTVLEVTGPDAEGELAAIPNFGKKSIDEVIETLSQRGLTLRTD